MARGIRDQERTGVQGGIEHELSNGSTFSIAAICSNCSWSSRSAGAPQARGQQGGASPAVSATEKPYLVEWVYKVKWGYADEFWQLFKKYQIATLNREKELGYVTSYTVYRPGLSHG